LSINGGFWTVTVLGLNRGEMVLKPVPKINVSKPSTLTVTETAPAADHRNQAVKEATTGRITGHGRIAHSGYGIEPRHTPNSDRR